LLFLPIWPGSEPEDSQPVGALTALSAAQRAVGDLAGICEREPDVCETGKKAVHTISVRARESARIAAEMLDPAEGKTKKPDEVAVGDPVKAKSRPPVGVAETAPIPPKR